MILREIESNQEDEWDNLIQDADYSTCFHQMGFLKAAEKHTKSHLNLLVAQNNNVSVAGIPLFIQKRAGFKMVFSPPLKTGLPQMGPVFKGYLDLRQSRRERLLLDFQKQVDEYIQKQVKPDFLFMATAPGYLDVRPWIWSGYTARLQYDYLLDLSSGREELFLGVRKKTRQKIREAEKQGVTVRRGDRADYINVITDVKQRYREQGLVDDVPLDLLTDIWNNLPPGSLRVIVAEKSGQRLGGVIQAAYKDRVWDWIGGSKGGLDAADANTLLQWKGIEAACSDGYRYHVEVGGNTPRLCDFKRKYNYVPHPYLQVKRYFNPLMMAVESAYLHILKPVRNILGGGGR